MSDLRPVPRNRRSTQHAAPADPWSRPVARSLRSAQQGQPVQRPPNPSRPSGPSGAFPGAR